MYLNPCQRCGVERPATRPALSALCARCLDAVVWDGRRLQVLSDLIRRLRMVVTTCHALRTKNMAIATQVHELERIELELASLAEDVMLAQLSVKAELAV